MMKILGMKVGFRQIVNEKVFENKNEFSTNSSSNYNEKNKEWKSSVCHGFVVINLIDHLLREIV